MFRIAFYEEPLLQDLSSSPSKEPKVVKGIPKALKRTAAIPLPNLDETQVVRHFHHLSQMNYGIDSGIYPLGSCTMKYNPKLNEEIARWEQFCCLHPYQPVSTIQGTLQMMYELERMLSEITGMDAFSLQPAAGAHGEFLGMLLTKAYHDHQKDAARTEVIIPDTAHGTNPASVTLAGYNAVELPSTEDGTVDLALLEKTVSEKTACFMLTNPNTLGIFESDILEIAKIVHKAGALLYYDGANMNAIMGKVRPGDMGFDIVHLNLHKTFSTPHGGGGPGSGPVGVGKKLIPFLPVPRIIKKDGTYDVSYDAPQSIGKLRGFYGNVGVLLRAYIYITMMGKEGLTEASEVAVLNSNYMKEKILTNCSAYELPYKRLRKHEFVLSCEKLLKDKGVRAMDVAKRLLDHGVHPPTVYFPLIVKEALMIEPTESEPKNDLDRYIDALISIAKEDSEKVKKAPYNMPVNRVDEVGATRSQILTWKQIP
jgi:glycine dehydrogenase subunit 2